MIKNKLVSVITTLTMLAGIPCASAQTIENYTSSTITNVQISNGEVSTYSAVIENGVPVVEITSTPAPTAAPETADSTAKTTAGVKSEVEEVIESETDKDTLFKLLKLIVDRLAELWTGDVAEVVPVPTATPEAVETDAQADVSEPTATPTPITVPVIDIAIPEIPAIGQ